MKLLHLVYFRHENTGGGLRQWGQVQKCEEKSHLTFLYLMFSIMWSSETISWFSTRVQTTENTCFLQLWTKLFLISMLRLCDSRLYWQQLIVWLISWRQTPDSFKNCLSDNDGWCTVQHRGRLWAFQKLLTFNFFHISSSVSCRFW